MAMDGKEWQGRVMGYKGIKLCAYMCMYSCVYARSSQKRACTVLILTPTQTLTRHVFFIFVFIFLFFGGRGRGRDGDGWQGVARVSYGT